MNLVAIPETYGIVKKGCELVTCEFSETVFLWKFVLLSTYFTFNKTIYRQTFGTPISSPLSPVIAEYCITRS